MESGRLHPPPHQSSSCPPLWQGLGAPGPGQIRARSYLCGWRCPAGQRLRALVPAAPAPPTQPRILTDAALGFSSSGHLMVPLHEDRSLCTSGALDRWSTSLCLIFLPSEWVCSCTRAPPVLGCMNKMHGPQRVGLEPANTWSTQRLQGSTTVLLDQRLRAYQSPSYGTDSALRWTGFRGGASVFLSQSCVCVLMGDTSLGGCEGPPCRKRLPSSTQHA